MKKQYLPVLILFISLIGNQAMSQAPYHAFFGTKDYVEYVEGNMPLVISIPHDGELKPEDISDRTCIGCSKNQDIYTIEIGKTLREHIFKLTGLYPYLIISHLHRSKLDPNRNIEEAAGDDQQAGTAWTEFHHFIDSAIFDVEQKYGKGLYIDLHGHRHKINRVELGYLLTGEELRLPDDFLNDESFYQYSSIRNLINNNKSHSYTEFLRGSESFGTMLANRGYAVVPSSDIPFPKEDEPIFSGGYNTEKHSSASGGTVDGIQVEIGLELRMDPVGRIAFAKALSEVVLKYLKTYYFESITY